MIASYYHRSLTSGCFSEINDLSGKHLVRLGSIIERVVGGDYDQYRCTGFARRGQGT